MHALVRMTWTEHERGWGQRPDGVSYHLDMASARDYAAKQWDAQRLRLGEQTPAEYTKADDPQIVEVPESLIQEVKDAGGVLWFHTALAERTRLASDFAEKLRDAPVSA